MQEHRTTIPPGRKNTGGKVVAGWPSRIARRVKARALPYVIVLCVALLACAGWAAASRAVSAPEPPPSLAPLPALAFRDLAGKEYHLRTAASESGKALAFVFLSTECPISNRYTPRLKRLAAVYQKKGIAFFAVYVGPHDADATIRAHASERGLTFPLIRDADGTLAKLVGATVTPEVAVVGRNGALRYRGRIDDSDDPAAVKARDFAVALDAIITGKPVKTPRTRAFGCAITFPAPPPAEPTVTYTRDIAPLLDRRCVECHREGEVGAIPLDTYAQAAKWAAQMSTEVQTRRMPPWKAESHDEFLGERRLSDAEIKTVVDWAAAGAPQGDPADLPKTRPTFPEGWKLGEPDYTVEMPVEYTVPAEGKDIYRCFVLPTDFDTDKWVASIEFQPGNRAIVHHINIWLARTGEARKRDAADPGPGYDSPFPGNVPGFRSAGVLGGWIPGHVPWTLPEGVGNRLPKGADIVFEVHYVTTGKPEKDRSRFGLRFVKGPVKKRLVLGEVSARRVRIPAGAKAQTVETSEFVREDITLLSITPHMHLLGRSMTVTAVFPDGTERRLVHVPDWNFNWQLSYRYKEPVKLPNGTRIDLLAVYDNSADNPYNPNRPPKDVREGESTSDEMCNAFVAYTLDNEDLTAKPGDGRR